MILSKPLKKPQLQIATDVKVIETNFDVVAFGNYLHQKRILMNQTIFDVYRVNEAIIKTLERYTPIEAKRTRDKLKTLLFDLEGLQQTRNGIQKYLDNLESLCSHRLLRGNYTINYMAPATAQVQYGRIIQFELHELEHLSTPLHELMHEFDQNLSQGQMLALLQSLIDHNAINFTQRVIDLSREMRDSLLRNDRCHEIFRALMLSVLAEDTTGEFFPKILLAQYASRNIIAHNQQEHFLHRVINSTNNVLPQYDQEKLETIQDIIKAYTYRGIKILDEIFARVQEDLSFDGQIYRIIRGLEGVENLEILDLFEAIAIDEIEKMKKVDINEQIIIQWTKYAQDIRHIKKWKEMIRLKSNIAREMTKLKEGDRLEKSGVEVIGIQALQETIKKDQLSFNILGGEQFFQNLNQRRNKENLNMALRVKALKRENEKKKNEEEEMKYKRNKKRNQRKKFK